MTIVSDSLAKRLDDLTSKGVIAGWKRPNGHNFGLSRKPLPALIYPSSHTGASTYHDLNELEWVVYGLETFGKLPFNHGRISVRES